MKGAEGNLSVPYFFFTKMCKSASENVFKRIIVVFFNGDGILIPLYRGRKKKEEIVMLANQRRCDT